MWEKIRPYVRNIYRIINGIRGFIYDIFRFVKYAGYKGSEKDIETRSYDLVRTYHGLEKSLSYKKRNPNSGWNNAHHVLHLLRQVKDQQNVGYHDKVAKSVLETFLHLPENKNTEKSNKILKELDTFNFVSNDAHGSIEYSCEDFERGILEKPENFFLSRYSLREFKDKDVEEEIIKKAINLALKTPSVCNRQPWAIYHTSEQKVKDIVLKYQSGNKPFGDKIPNLMIVSIDLKAFFSGNEHYQHWIEGGLFSMSLIYAFHSLGIATCALNWSQLPNKDKEIRKYLNIQNKHTIVMVLAIGYPDQNNKVCTSARKPLEEIYIELKEK